MKFTTQTTFALVSILIFLAMTAYTSNSNYIVGGFIFTFLFMPSEPKKEDKKDNNEITK